jgi:hypothetical protein
VLVEVLVWWLLLWLRLLLGAVGGGVDVAVVVVVVLVLVVVFHVVVIVAGSCGKSTLDAYSGIASYYSRKCLTTRSEHLLVLRVQT